VPSLGAALAERAHHLGDAALALAELGDAEPSTARDLGLEVASLEARMLLGSGVIDRIVRGSAAPADLGRLGRLETLVRLADNRVVERLAALDSQETSRPWQSLASAVSLAGGLFSIAKQIL